MFKSGNILQDRYKLIEPLGRTSLGRRTWLATDLTTNLQSLVVVKLLVLTEMQWQDLKLFEREAKVLQHLTNSKIPRYRDSFQIKQQTDSTFCLWGLVQDYISGDSLQKLLEQGKRFTELEVYQIAKQVLQILIYLHGLSPPVLHRDIKPSNLILDQAQQVWLVDFGAVQNQAATLELSFTVVGTVGYAPLEQFWGRAIAASDLYALGGTLVHLLTGVSPVNLPQHNLRLQFRTQTRANLLLIEWLEKLTEPSVERRFNSAQEAYTELELTNRKLRSVCDKPQHRGISSPKTIQRTKSKIGDNALSSPLSWYGLHGLCILSGLAMLTYGSSNYRTAASFEYKAISEVGMISKTEAKIYTSCTGLSTCMANTYYLSTVQFKTKQGTPIKFNTRDVCGSKKPYACVGRTIQVFYHPDDPEINMIKGGLTPMDRVNTWIGIGLVFVLGGIGSTWSFHWLYCKK